MPAQTRVYLVDDDPVQTAILTAYFSSLGFCPAGEYASAIPALAAITEAMRQDEARHLVVTDLKMDGMDGIAFIRKLAEAGYRGQIAIISASPTALIEGAARLARMHGLEVAGTCRKPLTKEALDKAFLTRLPSRQMTTGNGLKAFGPEAVAEGLSAGQFIPFYQPKLNLADGLICGAEALARWDHPEHGILSPGLFMRAIEENGLSTRLTFRLLDRILADLAEWQAAGVRTRVSLNITAAELALLDLPDRLVERLAANGAKPDQLIIEVTENAIVEFNTTSLEVLARLRLAGFEVAVDDFGTGYSNIQSIRDFPYSELKIDQSFVRGVGSDPFMQESVTSSIALGRQMNMRLIAEGVENRADLEFLRKRGIDEIQGYYFAKPMSARDFLALQLRHVPGSFGAAQALPATSAASGAA